MTQVATIISNFRPFGDKFFASDYVYHQVVMKKILESKDFDFIPISYENNFINLFPENEAEKEKSEIENMIYNMKIHSYNLMICFDRGFTEEMEDLAYSFIKRNPKGKIFLFSIYSGSNTAFNALCSKVNNDTQMSQEERIQLIRVFADRSLKENRMNYQTASDLTSYRKKYALTVGNGENLIMNKFIPILENKIDRDIRTGRNEVKEKVLKEAVNKWGVGTKAS